MADTIVCKNCRAGRHHHDTYPGTGADAGCPYSVEGGKACACWVQVPAPATHKCPTCGAVHRG